MRKTAIVTRASRDIGRTIALRLAACLFDMGGTVVAGENCASFAELRSRVSISRSSEVDLRYGLVRVALVITGSGGREYIFATELPAGPRTGTGLDRTGLALRLAVAIFVSGFVCYLLTVYLTRPIVDVSKVAGQLALGSLSARTSAGIERRRDELGTLAREFNAMSARIEGLVSQQRQLILDISHELRSPLARLNVALDLAKAGKGGNLPFQHMESDVMRLDEMIGRLLTIAKLNAVGIPAETTCVDLTELVGRIAESAAFEAQKRGVAVELSTLDRFQVRGSAELLHSAIENVVRNAIRYTGFRTTVEISLRPQGRFADLALDSRPWPRRSAD